MNAKPTAHKAKQVQQYLMSGVSYMIPVVVTGGVLYAIATMLSMSSVTTEGAVKASNILIDVLSQIGGVGLGLMVPVLSAFIAFAIADRPGIAPGLICGQLAVNVGSGFIGGIIAGLLCGYLANVLKKIELPKSMQSLLSIMIVPICTSLVVGTLVICVIGAPCAWLLQTLTKWLTGMSGASAILVGAICGAMIGFDLGGPVNKVAYSTGVAVVGTEVLAGLTSNFLGLLPLPSAYLLLQPVLLPMFSERSLPTLNVTLESALLSWESVVSLREQFHILPPTLVVLFPSTLFHALRLEPLLVRLAFIAMQHGEAL